MVPLTQIKEIIIHCTANRPGCKMTMQDFRRLHRARGYEDVGYHFIVFEDGRVEAGRSIEYQGAHCNGIAYVGGLNAQGVTEDTRTPAQRTSMLLLIRKLSLQYHVPVYGHRDFDKTKCCPCFDAHTEYSWV